MKNERMRGERGNWHMRAGAYYAREAFVVPTAMKINHGLEDREGIVRVTCKRCKSVMVQKRMGRRHNRIDVYAPEGQD